MKYLVCAAALLACGVSAKERDAMSHKLADLKQPEVQALRPEVVILPIGSTEPHANHLPYSTDTLTADMLASKVAAQANAMGARIMVLPTMPFGVNTNVAPIPYAQSIRPATMLQFIKDVVGTLEQQGIRKVVILNGHGGNTSTVSMALRELVASNPKVFVTAVSTWTPYQDEVKGILENMVGDHSGEEETSIALALFPELVEMGKARIAVDSQIQLDSMKAPYIEFIRPWKFVSDNTGQGDPTRATAAKGGKMIDIFVERVSRFLKELSEAKLTERFPYTSQAGAGVSGTR